MIFFLFNLKSPLGISWRAFFLTPWYFDRCPIQISRHYVTICRCIFIFSFIDIHRGKITHFIPHFNLNCDQLEYMLTNQGLLLPLAANLGQLTSPRDLFMTIWDNVVSLFLIENTVSQFLTIFSLSTMKLLLRPQLNSSTSSCFCIKTSVK